jgi:hypothetical protein
MVSWKPGISFAVEAFGRKTEVFFFFNFKDPSLTGITFFNLSFILFNIFISPPPSNKKGDYLPFP